MNAAPRSLDAYLLNSRPRPGLSGVRRALVEFVWFGFKEARACLFAGLFFLAVFGVPRAPLLLCAERGDIVGVSIEAKYILGAIAIGIGATLSMDLWNFFLKRTFSIPSLNYCLLGRWLRHMPTGTFGHASIAAAPRKRFECKVGWIAHYTIGVVFAVVFLFLMSGDWLARPTFPPAVLYGIGTVVFPFFVMQPSLGLGIAASRTPKPVQARLKSLVTHTVFGVGLYVCALGMSYVLRVRG